MENFEITCHPSQSYGLIDSYSGDCEILETVWNMGIDSRLEGFIKSTAKLQADGRFSFDIHPDELQILIRRLCELGNEEAERLLDDIIFVRYGIEFL